MKQNEWIVLGIILGIATILHALIINIPSNTFVGDETYYFNAAWNFVHGFQANNEHPPLVKAAIAAIMWAVHSTCTTTGCTVAWALRLPSVIAGIFSIAFVYLIARKFVSAEYAAIASLLMLTETMFFSLTSQGTLEAPMLCFALAAIMAYFYVNSAKWLWVGGLFGLALLSKETAIFLFAVLLIYDLFQYEMMPPWEVMATGFGATHQKFTKFLKWLVIGGIALGVTILGFELYDLVLTAGPIVTHNFVQSLQYILNYIPSLNCSYSAFQCNGAFTTTGGTITPLNWITYYVAPFYQFQWNTYCVAAHCFSVWNVTYYGGSNMLEVWPLWIWVPLALLYAKRKALDALGLFALCGFAVTYLPNLYFIIEGRVTYPYYFLLSTPFIVLGDIWLLQRLPKPITYVFVAASIIWFIVFFPVMAWLPPALHTFAAP